MSVPENVGAPKWLAPICRATFQNEEFVAIQEFLADAADLIDFRVAKAEDAAEPTVPLSKVKVLLSRGE